jgi:hypothetical protein
MKTHRLDPRPPNGRPGLRRRWAAVLAAVAAGGVLSLTVAAFDDDPGPMAAASPAVVSHAFTQAPLAGPSQAGPSHDAALLAAAPASSAAPLPRAAPPPDGPAPDSVADAPRTDRQADASFASKAPKIIRLPRFGSEPASAEARHVAQWALYSGDNEGRAVVIVDKRQARIFIFNPEGELLRASPVLLGSAIGDHTVPGVGDKPVAQVLPEERTTPAGRFIAEMGESTVGEDVVWVDYDAAVSMHRVRPWVPSERRLERLASPTPLDNRISYGCINLPRQVYEDVLAPTVRRDGAVVYVLPELSTPQQVFGSYDVPNADVLALFANKSQ